SVHSGRPQDRRLLRHHRAPASELTPTARSVGGCLGRVLATVRGMSLPKQRDPARPYRISLVCLGNICRSPMAEKVVAAELERAGLSDLVEVDSSGTGELGRASWRERG